MTGEAPPSWRKRLLDAANGVFLLVGIIALVWLVRRIGAGEVARTIKSIGLWAIALLALSFTTLCLNAAAIRVFMRPESRMVSYWRVLGAQLSGQAINSVTPMATLGELTKVTMLLGHVPRHRAVSSVVAFNIVNLGIKGCYLLLALSISLLAFDFPAELDWILRGTMVAVVTVGAVAIVATHVGLVRTFTAASEKLGFISAQRRQRIAERLGALDDQMRLFGRDREADYTAGIALIALAQAIAIVDMWVLLEATGHRQAVMFVVVTAIAGSLVGTIASVVPLGIGANEGGLAGLFGLLGLGAVVGLAIGLVMRLRTVVVAAIGLSAMLVIQLVDQARNNRRLEATRARAAART